MNLVSNKIIKTIYDNRSEFEEYRKNGYKLTATKALKDYTGCGLKEGKEAMDLYFDGKLLLVKEERKEKLERLAKKPLIDELVSKIVNLKEDELINIFINLTIDELLSIDEYFDKPL